MRAVENLEAGDFVGHNVEHEKRAFVRKQPYIPRTFIGRGHIQLGLVFPHAPNGFPKPSFPTEIPKRLAIVNIPATPGLCRRASFSNSVKGIKRQ
jgi:hypothetical protein